MMKKVVLLVDDDFLFLYPVACALDKAGYRTVCQHSLDDLLPIISQVRPDIILLDVEVNGKNSIDILPEVYKAAVGVPVILISSHIHPDEIGKGLGAGCICYLKKPIDVQEILVYVNHHTARCEHSRFITVGRVTLDTESRILSKEGNQEKVLSVLEYKLFYLLASKVNQTVTREEIMEALWEGEILSNEQSLNNYILRLRKLILSDTTLEIKTIHGIGYSLLCKADKG